MNGVFDWLMFASIAICIAVWPTQVITASQNRWLRLVTIVLTFVQVLVSGPRLPLLPAYLVIVIFILRLLPKKNPATQAVTALSLAQWAVVGAAATALLSSVVLSIVFPRQ